jgi:hypothetical protein
VLFLALALLPNVGGVRTFVGLNVLEASFLVAHSVKLLTFGATVSCPLGHLVRLSQLNKQELPHQPRAADRAIQYVQHTDGVEMFNAVCKLGLVGIVSKKINAPYKSGPSKAWLKIKNPKAPAATRAMELSRSPGVLTLRGLRAHVTI